MQNPDTQKAKQSAAAIQKEKHEATLERKALTRENTKARTANAQLSLERAVQNYNSNPTLKLYRFWQAASSRTR